uniref:Uncharacterized protein n=1 Tax=Thermosporothrix sp. COM3 TaxID=2490863 RepID=A0A455SI56_9CHLR|nr:hypothetical protein KTC_17720 [Thermosporothrix sp. COM3]
MWREEAQIQGLKMSSLSQQELLRQVLNEQQERICQMFPQHRERALVALTRANDWRFLSSLNDPLPAAPPLFPSGWLKALLLCFDTTTIHARDESIQDIRADQILSACDQVTAGEQVLAFCESGFMRMQQGGQADFSVWIASKKKPTEWVEREDIEGWTSALARLYRHELQQLAQEKELLQQQLNEFASHWQAETIAYRTTPEIDAYYTRVGMVHGKILAYHFPYAGQTVIGDCTAQLYREVLATLIGFALKHIDLCKAWVGRHPAFPLRALLAPVLEVDALIAALSEVLDADRKSIGHAVEVLSLSHENVAYHCSVAGAPTPPLLRLNERALTWSLMGLLSMPCFFLMRELRRLHSYEYQRASSVLEESFRQDVYRLFSDRRFERSDRSIALKDKQGRLITDVDAMIFDRKTGALALFELKSQDPFAYSPQERIRQQAYFYNARKQVLACAQWLKQNGASTLLTRLESRQVKRLKVHKVFLFVLGRYLAHFFDGPVFDQNAAWGTWPQVLRLTHAEPFSADATHPIQSLYTRLRKDAPLTLSNPAFELLEVTIGERCMRIYPDFQAYRTHLQERTSGRA